MRKTLSVAIITKNEEANLARTLQSVAWADEILIIDSGSTDRTADIAGSFHTRFFVEEWKGFAAQKNSAVVKCSCQWILSLDADEVLTPELATEIRNLLEEEPKFAAYYLKRRNYFLGRWIRHGGYYPDPKLRLFRSGVAYFEARPVHETLRLHGESATLQGDMLHHAYGSLEQYIEHMNRYSSLGAGIASEMGQTSLNLFSFIWNVLLNPAATFIYNYIFRAGFLDGREGLLLHVYHSVYISWKYAKAWQQERQAAAPAPSV